MPEPDAPFAESASVAGRPEFPASAARVVQELLDEHREAWCDLVLISQGIWAIRGSIAYEGQVILAEFDSRGVAELALERLVTSEGSTYTR